jgi:hypothetical protein
MKNVLMWVADKFATLCALMLTLYYCIRYEWNKEDPWDDEEIE